MRVTAALVIALIIVLLSATVLLQHEKNKSNDYRMKAESQKTRADGLAVALKAEAKKEKIVIRYVDRIQYIARQGATIVKELTKYVSSQSDRACAVPVGFVVVHNAAAAGVPADAESARDPDAPAAGVALSTIAETVADNYTSYHACAAQLTALQEYVLSIEGATSE